MRCWSISQPRSGAGPLALLAAGGIESLEVERGKADVLAMGDKTRLVGTASCGEFAVATAFGERQRALRADGGAGGGVRAARQGPGFFCGTARYFPARSRAADFRFVMPSGARVDLDLGTLDRLVRKCRRGRRKMGAGNGAMLLTHQGDQVALARANPATFQCTTPWGPLRCTLDDILWLGPTEDGPSGITSNSRMGAGSSDFFQAGR